MTEQQQGRVALVTGASSGIGLAAAKSLAAQGWHVIGHGRDPGRTATAEAEIRAAAAPGARVDMVRGDLALMAETARMADEIAGLTDKVHVLIANAGGVRAERVVTAEGNEATFAGNHLGHFLLTKRLMPLLRAAAATSPPGTVRVVSVSSDAAEMGGAVDFEDLQAMHDWSTGKSYCLAKLCNVLFTRELARRAAPDNIIANAMHPGVVASNFTNHAPKQMQDYMATLEAATPDNAADTLLWLATTAEGGETSGGFFHNRQQRPPVGAVEDDAAAARLWTESDKLLEKAGV